MGVGGIFVTLRAFTDKFKVDMKKAKASVERFRTSTVNINRQLKKVGKTMSKVGSQMSTNFTLPIVAAGGLAVKTFADFEQEMAKVKAVSGATGAEFTKLEQLAKDLGASTRFTAAQVAELELNYSKLGFVPAEIEKITKPTLDLALATGEDLANSAEVAGSTLRGLGLQAAEMPKVVDVMAASFSSSALDLESFKESMKLVAPTAVATGRDMETVTAQLGVLANNGIKGSIAGTQLNRVFLELNKQGLSLEDAMDQVSSSSNGLATATGLVKDRGAKALLILAKQRKELGPLEDKLRSAEGAAASMADTMDNTLNGALLKVQSALEGAAIELGNTLAPIIKKAGEFIAELANKFSNLSPRTKKTIAVIGGLVAAIGPLLLVLGTLTSTVLPAIMTGFAALTGPIGLAVVAITAIGAAALVTYQHLNRVQSAQSVLNDTMDAAAKSVAAEVAEIDKLVKIAGSENLSREKRAAAVQKLQDKYPDYLENLDLESIKSGKAKTSIDQLKTSILKVAQARAIEAKIQEIQAKKLEIVTSSGESSLTTWDKISSTILKSLPGVNRYAGVINDVKVKTKRAAESTEAYDEQINTLIGSLAELEEQGFVAPDEDDEPSGKGKGVDVTPELDANRLAFNKWAQEALKGTDIIIEGTSDIGDNLELALIEARDFSAALGETPVEILERQRAVLKAYIDEASDGGKIITDDIRKQIAAYDELGKKIDAIPEKTKTLKETIEDAMNEMAAAAEGFRDAVVGSVAGGIGEALGEALDDGDGQETIKSIFKNIFGLMKQFGEQMIKIGVPLMLIGVPLGFQYTIGGTALVAAATFAAAQFAEGGLVFGETLGMVGEGRGTTRSNPEVIAPLDKLQGMLGGMGAGGGGVTEFVLRGETLRAVTNKVADNRSFTVRE